MSNHGEPFERGYKLGKYEVISRLSIGGMAELYLASLAGQGGFRKFVVLKRVLPSVAEQDSFVKMFLDEARITAALSHANVAQVYELAETPGSAEPVLAMEYVPGHTLAQITYRSRAGQVALEPGFGCRVMHDVLLGLHYAHHFIEPASGRAMPVVHRDINPRNIMVTYSGGTKIIDFGIAKARGRLDQTMAGIVKGTLQYMSPEQVQQEELDGRSDLFAASVVLYELLSGERLFDDATEAQSLERIAKADVPSLASVAPSLPARLVEVVMKGLARRPEDRWRSGRDYARALDLACPQLFDDEQVAGLMSQLFADTIAASRALLHGSSGEVSEANLQVIAKARDEAELAPSRPTAPPIGDVPTMPSHQRLEDGAPARPRVEDLELPETVNERPVPRVDPPTDLGPLGMDAEETNLSATVVIAAPPLASSGLASALTEADLEPVVTGPAPKEVKTTLARAQVEAGRPREAGRPPEPKRDVDAPPPGRRPTREAPAAQRGPPLTAVPALRRPTAAAAPAVIKASRRRPSGAAAAGDERPRIVTPGETGSVEPVITETPATGGGEKLEAPGRGLWVGLVVSVLVLLAAVAVYVTSAG